MTHDNTEDNEKRIEAVEDDEGGAPIYNEDGGLVALHFASFSDRNADDDQPDES